MVTWPESSRLLVKPIEGKHEFDGLEERSETSFNCTLEEAALVRNFRKLPDNDTRMAFFDALQGFFLG